MRHQTLRLVVFAGLLGGMACGGGDAGGEAISGDTASTLALPDTQSAVDSAAAPADTDTNADPLTLRPGDVITWTPSAPHRVQFGGTVTSGGAQITLPSFQVVSKILTDFQPALTADANGVAIAPAGVKVTARVRDDAATAGGSSFFFTCGVPPHRGVMVTKVFTIAPASAEHPQRDVQIVSANGPFRWVLKSGQEDIDLTRP